MDGKDLALRVHRHAFDEKRHMPGRDGRLAGVAYRSDVDPAFHQEPLGAISARLGGGIRSRTKFFLQDLPGELGIGFSLGEFHHLSFEKV